MRTLTGTILQIPRFVIFAGYMTAMSVIFLVTAVISFPIWIVGQFKN